MKDWEKKYDKVEEIKSISEFYFIAIGKHTVAQQKMMLERQNHNHSEFQSDVHELKKIVNLNIHVVEISNFVLIISLYESVVYFYCFSKLSSLQQVQGRLPVLIKGLSICHSPFVYWNLMQCI